MGAKLDRPEAWLAIHGFLVAFVWEMFQMPFFVSAGLSVWQVTMRCGLASFGDAGIMVIAYLGTSWIKKDMTWLQRPERLSLIAYLAIGLAITVVVEFVAVRVPWGWRYSDLMPEIFGIGLIPLLMWVVVPLTSLALTARSACADRNG
ncbi:hypothetical protein [Pelagerythrobacter marensis]|uniref:Uncharacterized protein n=1 Tax=Pelagerythrobacter marensis TaxID=543877 RepID=A0A0G3XA58_9SPHN|nr:hypothetical protein [Pelagerythrobacter marensis]AKM07504.1 hypothetical protein AM2010_1432 [Pelagerythrobacter marensis]